MFRQHRESAHATAAVPRQAEVAPRAGPVVILPEAPWGRVVYANTSDQPLSGRANVVKIVIGRGLKLVAIVIVPHAVQAIGPVHANHHRAFRIIRKSHSCTPEYLDFLYFDEIGGRFFVLEQLTDYQASRPLGVDKSQMLGTFDPIQIGLAALHIVEERVEFFVTAQMNAGQDQPVPLVAPEVSDGEFAPP